MKWVCEQRGCGEYSDGFFGEDEERVCPVCNHPLVGKQGELTVDSGSGEAPWSDYTIAELREYVDDWGIDVDGSISRVPKVVLIAALEAFEAAQGSAAE